MITRKQCQICSDYKVIKNKDISRFPNAECDAFNCESCLEQWYKEKMNVQYVIHYYKLYFL